MLNNGLPHSCFNKFWVVLNSVLLIFKSPVRHDGKRHTLETSGGSVCYRARRSLIVQLVVRKRRCILTITRDTLDSSSEASATLYNSTHFVSIF